MDKNILMLSWVFPPANYMAGRRAYGLSKYLKRYGWQPYVCTAQVAEGQFFTGGIDADKKEELKNNTYVIRVPFKTNRSYPFVKRILRYGTTALFPTTQPLDYYLNSMQILPSLIAENSIRVIWATYPPPAPLRIAYNLHKKYKIPWIADFRDLWDQKYMYNKYFSFRQETSITKYLRTSSHIVAVTPAIANKIERITNKPVSFIYNGYDPEEYLNVQGMNESDKNVFEIVYTGSILNPPMRDPVPVFKAIDLLLKNKVIDAKRFKIVFYGANTQLLNSLLGDSICKSICLIHKSIPHSKAVEVQQKATILLHLSHSGEKGIMTGKIFEYLGARRPILSVPGDGDSVGRLLEQTRAGCCKASVEDIAHQIKLWYDEKQRYGFVHYAGLEWEIEKYSYLNVAKHLVEVLDKLPI